MSKKNSKNLCMRGQSSDNAYNHENSFYWLSQPSRIFKLLAQYELYQSIVSIPGDIIEIGVYKAASLIRLATFRQTLENDNVRKIIGFDAFGMFPRENISLPSDRDFIDKFEKTGGEGLSIEEVTSIIEYKGFKNIRLIQGNILNTLEKYLEQFPATRIAMLHLDVDVKEPTQHALEHLYEKIVPNGIIVIDDYGLVEGATEAIDFFAKKNKLNIQKTKHYTIPAYIKKPSY